MEGGSANDYDYADGDPVNSFDLDGTRSCKWNHPSDCGKAVGRAAKKVAKNPVFQTVVGAAACTVTAGACVGAALVFAAYNGATSYCKRGVMTAKCIGGVALDAASARLKGRSTLATFKNIGFRRLGRDSFVYISRRAALGSLKSNFAYNLGVVGGYNAARYIVGRASGY